MPHSLRVTGQRYVAPEEVQVRIRDFMQAFCGALRQKYGIDGDAYLNSKGQLVCDERGWRHGSVGTDMLDAKPSAEKVRVMRFMEQLNSYVMELEGHK